MTLIEAKWNFDSRIKVNIKLRFGNIKLLPMYDICEKITKARISFDDHKAIYHSLFHKWY